MDRQGQSVYVVAAVALLGMTVSARSASSADPVRQRTPRPTPSVPAAAAPQPQTVQWQRDLRAAHQLSVKTGKPMILVFGASWCGYCKKLDQETFGQPQLARYVNDRFVAIHLDFDKDKRAVEVLGITNLPCTVILSPEADLLDRHVGFAGPGEFYQVLRKADQKNTAQRAKPSAVQPAVGRSTMSR